MILEIRYAQMVRVDVEFGQSARIEVLAPWQEGNAKFALHLAYLFDELKRFSCEVDSAPWIEIIEPLNVQSCSEKDIDLRFVDEADVRNLTKYTFVTDGGDISVVSRLGRSEIIARRSRGR